jgi:indole-3-glycerol phosphate synthase
VSEDFLAAMARASRTRVAAARQRLSQAALEQQLQGLPAPPALRLHGFDLIAELKLRSPAAGALSTADAGLEERIAAYARGGAAAVSVLTEPSRFDGSLAHLRTAAALLRPQQVPVMRKDFLVDPYQVLEARLAGAGGVLLILRMLARSELEALLDCAHAQGMFVLLEAFDAGDIEQLHELLGRQQGGTLLAGVNCRDLTTLQVVPQRLAQLAPLLPRGVPRVAESGVSSPRAARAAAEAGYQLILVGSALMRGSDPAQLAASLLTAGRAAGAR